MPPYDNIIMGVALHTATQYQVAAARITANTAARSQRPLVRTVSSIALMRACTVGISAVIADGRRWALLAPSPSAMATTAMPPANPATPARTRSWSTPARGRPPARSGSPARSGPPSGSGPPTGSGRRSPLPSATSTTAIPPTNPAARARWRPTPARGRSPTGSRPPTRSTRWSPPLRFSQEVRRFAGQSKLRGDLHRLRGLDETNPDGADRCGGNGILRKAKESTAGGSIHRLLLFCYAVLRAD